MHPYLAAAGLGAATGLRSFTGLAMASRELGRRPAGEVDALRAWLTGDVVAYAVSGLAIAEIVADKLPDVPDRIDPVPLAGRGVLGATVGAIAGGEDHWVAGAVIGAIAAVTSAWIGWAVRKEAGWATGLPDPVLAIVEDAVAIGAAKGAAGEM